MKDLKSAHQNFLLPAQVEAQHRDRDAARQAEYQKYQDEMKQLKLELAKARKANTGLETTLKEEKHLRAEEQKGMKETNERDDAVEKQLDKLKAKPAQWLSELRWIDEQLSSKFLHFPCLSGS